MANRSENYNRTGSPNLHGSTPSDGGSTWVEESAGSWKTDTDGASGRVVAYNLGGPVAAWLESSVTDYDVEVDIVTVIANVGVVARLADVNNYYLWRSLAGTTQLYKQVSGSYTLLGTGSIGAASGDRLKLKCNGTAITGYVNGSSSLAVTDSSLSAGTNVGIYGGSGYADDFASTDLGGGGGSSIIPIVQRLARSRR